MKQAMVWAAPHVRQPMRSNVYGPNLILKTLLLTTSCVGFTTTVAMSSETKSETWNAKTGNWKMLAGLTVRPETGH